MLRDCEVFSGLSWKQKWSYFIGAANFLRVGLPISAIWHLFLQANPCKIRERTSCWFKGLLFTRSFSQASFKTEATPLVNTFNRVGSTVFVKTIPLPLQFIQPSSQLISHHHLPLLQPLRTPSLRSVHRQQALHTALKLRTKGWRQN